MSSFSEILTDHGIPYRTEGQGCRPGWVQFQCPFCGGGRDANKLYAGFCIASNAVNCWVCGKHDAAQTLATLTGLSYNECREHLKQLVPATTRAAAAIKRKLIIPPGVKPLGPAHKRYLKERGFDPTALEMVWGLQGIGLAPRLAWRIFIPIVYHGNTVNWTTRTIGDQEPRYISARPEQELVSIKKCLFGEDYVRRAVIVTEGPFDAMRIGQGAVALCGTAVTPAQIKKLAKFPIRVIVLDSEPAAQMRAQQLFSSLEVFSGRTIKVELDAKDPASAPEHEINLLRRSFLK